MEKKSVHKKVKEELPEFAQACEGLSASDLDAKLAQFAKDSEAVQESKDADEALSAAKASMTELGAPYREAKSVIKLKTKYVLELIKERS